MRLQIGPEDVALLDHIAHNKDAKGYDIAKALDRASAVIYQSLKRLNIMGLIDRYEESGSQRALPPAYYRITTLGMDIMDIYAQVKANIDLER